MNRRSGDRSGLWIGTAVLALAAAARPARAQPSKPPPAVTSPTPATDPALPGAVVPDIAFKPKGGGALVSLNLEDADLAELVKAIGNLTGKRFVLSPKLRSFKATVFAPEKVTVAEAYDAFLAILAGNGMTVVPHGRFLEIVESQTAAQRPLQVFGPGAPVPAEERFVTRLYRPMHLGADEVAGVLDKLRSKDGQVLAAGSGLLVITDSGAIIRRMLEVMAEVDVEAAGQKVWVQPIHYAAAKDVASLIADLVGGDGAGRAAKSAAPSSSPAAAASAGRLRLLADERTNALVIVGSDADYQRVLALLERIDVPRSSEGQLHTLPLQNASCKELSGTLLNLLGSGGASAPGGAKGGRAATTDEVFEGPMRVTCDELSNKLVAVGSMRDFAELRRVVDDLDEPRRQVYIEAVILDVGVQRVTDLGLGFHGGIPIDGGAMYGGSNAAQSVTGLPSRLEGLALGVKGPDLANTNGLAPNGLSIPAFGVVVHALAEDSRSQVLATPHVLATDNVKAEISIGENIPLQQNAGAAQLTSQGIPIPNAANGLRQDVGTKIIVTPHVNDSNLVRLEIVEEISSEGKRAGDLAAVSINQRRATTTLVVEDQQTVVIGGLVRDVALEAQSKIPVLGDIPLLGALFRQSTTTMQKSNLLLILTPYVVRNAEDLRAIFERKMQERQEFLDRHFVFREEQDWSPPNDFRRTNGLLEGIRQSMREVDEQARVLAEARSKTPTTHAPTEPVDLPSSVRPAGSATTAVKSAEPAAAQVKSNDAPPTPNTNPAPARPKPKGLGRIE